MEKDQIVLQQDYHKRNYSHSLAFRDQDAPSRYFFLKLFCTNNFCFSSWLCQGLDDVQALGGSCPRQHGLTYCRYTLRVLTPCDSERRAWPSASYTASKRRGCSRSTDSFHSPAPKSRIPWEPVSKDGCSPGSSKDSDISHSPALLLPYSF